MYKKMLYIFVISFACNTQSMNVGSDSAVALFETQQLLDDGDRITGFAALEAGFELVSMNTTATFDSVFPVSGDVSFFGGTLILNQDLIFQEVATIETLGNIQGNGHRLELAATMTCVPEGFPLDLADCTISLVDTEPGGSNTLSVSWSYDDRYIALGRNAGTELQVFEFDGTSLTLVDSIETIRVRSVDWHPSEYYLATATDNAAGDEELIIYSFDGSSLTEIDSDEQGANLNAVAYHPSGNYLVVGGDSDTREIVLYPVNGDGTLDAASEFVFNLSPNEDVRWDALSWSATGTYLAVGTTAGGTQECFVMQLEESPLGLVINATFDVPSGNVDTVAFNPFYDDKLAIGGNFPSPELRILQHDPLAGTLTQIEDVAVGNRVRTLGWRRGGQCLAMGRNSGAGTELRIYDYDDATEMLTESQGFELGTIGRSVRWSHSGQYLAVGLNGEILRVYQSNALLNDMCFEFSDVHVVLNCNVALKNCCLLFSGDSSISGAGKTLSLSPTCTILLDSDSNLLIKDIDLKGIGTAHLAGVDATSTFSFQDVRMYLDNDYTFSQGRFDVIKDLEIIGKNKSFIYQANQVSTIAQCGRLMLDTAVTFSYDPFAATHNLLQFVNHTSELILHSATLHTTTSLQLTKGHLVVEGQSNLSSESNGVGEGFVFGDGVDAVNNVCVEINPAAQLNLTSGRVENKNV